MIGLKKVAFLLCVSLTLLLPVIFRVCNDFYALEGLFEGIAVEEVNLKMIPLPKKEKCFTPGDFSLMVWEKFAMGGSFNSIVVKLNPTCLQ
jgi:hypothetical protein